VDSNQEIGRVQMPVHPDDAIGVGMLGPNDK